MSRIGGGDGFSRIVRLTKILSSRKGDSVRPHVSPPEMEGNNDSQEILKREISEALLSIDINDCERMDLAKRVVIRKMILYSFRSIKMPASQIDALVLEIQRAVDRQVMLKKDLEGIVNKLKGGV